MRRFIMPPINTGLRAIRNVPFPGGFINNPNDNHEMANLIYETNTEYYQEFFRLGKGVGGNNARIHKQLIACAVAKAKYDNQDMASWLMSPVF